MEQDVSRRDFIRCAGTTALLAALGLQVAACDTVDDPGGQGGTGGTSGITISGNTITFDLTKNDTKGLSNSGAFLLIQSASTIVINDAGSLRAFTSICTHQGCTVNRFEENRIKCPCHGSQYDTSGQVVAGPAPSPLREFNVTKSGNTVTITKTT